MKAKYQMSSDAHVAIYNYRGKSADVLREFNEGKAFFGSGAMLINVEREHIAFYPTHPVHGSCWMLRDRVGICLAVSRRWRNLPNATVNGTGQNWDY